ncbi:MAG: ABC transporter permease, partial [Anderseniella sp.]|nr:ABC transporter permease [Anderseniella sp.]
AVVLASFSKQRYFRFPITRYTTEWYSKTLESLSVRDLLWTSLSVAALVTVFSVVLAFFGALAFARYDWKGRKLYQKLVLLPIFFPQAVLGLALLLWFSALGVITSWQTAVFAHMIWIVPIVILIMSIQAYSFDPALEEAAFDLGASRWQVLREVTLPILAPGIVSGGIFAFLLSWGNFPLSLFSTGADSTVPEWLYAKMVSGYTPMVPTLGSLTMSAAALLLVIVYLAWLAASVRRKRNSVPTDS